MSSYAFNYAFNISGNCNAAVAEISENVAALRNKVADATSAFSQMEKTLIVFNQASQYCQQLKSSFEQTLAPGAALNAAMADLQAVSGASGKELEFVEKAARSTAKEFGISASGAVESYKLLLSQLSPELTKNGEALSAMGRHVATLSKTMGNDAKAAAEVLTTAMNQYGVSLEDPMEASRQMAEMMNIMAAAGREGSAELPTIKEALSQCGMAAKAAGVSFAETNAAIQVLDKAGKKGSEGGVALRNVMSTLAQGRFLPKDVREELAAAGVDINKLTDKSKTLSERLTLLKPVMADSALFSKLFGKENANAAMALVQGIGTVEKWTEAITGTNTAVDQSKIVMETYNEKLARVNASFDDMKISIFNCCGDMGIWVQVVAGALVPVAQLVPLISGLFTAFSKIPAALKLMRAGLVSTITFMRGLTIESIRLKATQLQMYFALVTAQIKRTLVEGIKLRAIQLHKAFDKVSSKCRDIIVHLLGLDTALMASGGFFTAFKVVAQNACRAIGTAIMNIPIVGWIAAGIALVIAVVQQLWDKCKGFRIAVFTAWEAIKAFGNALMIIFRAIGEQIVAAFGVVKKVASFIAEMFSIIWEGVVGTMNNIFNEIKGVFARIMSFLQPFFDRVAAIFGTIRDKIASVADWLAGAFNAAVSAVVGVWDKITGAVASVVSGIKQGVAAAADFVRSIPERITTAFENIKAFIASVADWLASAFNTAVAAIVAAWNWVVEAVVSVVDGIKSAINTALEFIMSIPDRIMAAWEAVRGYIASLSEWLAGVFDSVVAFIAGIWSRITEAVAVVVDNIVGFFNAAVENITMAWNAVVDFILGIVNNVVAFFTEAWNNIVGVVTSFVDRVVEIFTSLWNTLRGFGERMVAIFSNVFARIRAAFSAVRNWIANVVNAIVAKIRSICAPLINAFNTVSTRIKSMFGGVLDWVKGQIDSVINWFVDLYNKIADAMGWDKIKAAGKAAGEKSWAKDHPKTTTTTNPATTPGTSASPIDDTVADPAGGATGAGGGSAIGDGLKGIGGSSDKTDRVKNINITIEKLIDTFTISTTTMSETKERVKDMVAEALLNAVNDANYAL